MTVYYVLFTYWILCAVAETIVCRKLYERYMEPVRRRAWWKEVMVSPITLPMMLTVAPPMMLKKKEEVEKRLLSLIDTLTEEDSSVYK